MEKGAREKAMWLLRTAGDILEEEEGRWILPGWDPEDEAGMNDADRRRHEGIRKAAGAVLAEGLSPHECTRPTIESLGMLVRYVGDMLEE